MLLVFHFQQKLFLPTLCLAIGIGFAGYLMPWSVPIIKGTGFGYTLAGVITHYFIYELRHPNEYYFYHNKGFNKPSLYGLTLILNLAISILILVYE